ncbi:MAG: hypothetical protein IPK60_14900 [Sandaracinaceae bacterium]|nr:hypothetical protein [Sandaracinaceae bacterium]
MRARRLCVVLLLWACACTSSPSSNPLEGPNDPIEAAQAFVNDAATRRRALEASIAVADTPYARLRAEHYALSGTGIDNADGDWDALAVYAPRVRTLRITGAMGSLDLHEGEAVALDSLDSLQDWERAGERAFERLPAQIDLGFARLRDRDSAIGAGFTVDDDGVVNGAVEVATSTGWVVALTCSACHSAELGGVRVNGLANDRLDLATLGGGSWPRGTVDVTSDSIDNPLRPPDLRPLIFQTRLHHTGNLANGRLARMVRIETLLTVQYGAHSRPDRRAVAALALYLESLARTLPQPEESLPASRIFESACGECHRGDALAGDPVEVGAVGTNPSATIYGSERSTLGYRAPSLRGVEGRRGLLHDGSATDLDAILGLTPSTHIGHPFGRTLDESARRSIASFLRSSSSR